MSLRCKKIGHLRKECRSPWCRVCRSYGHLEEDCVQTYASRTQVPVSKEALDNTMGPEDMDATGLVVPSSSGAPEVAPVVQQSPAVVVDEVSLSPVASCHVKEERSLVAVVEVSPTIASDATGTGAATSPVFKEDESWWLLRSLLSFARLSHLPTPLLLLWCPLSPLWWSLRFRLIMSTPPRNVL